MTSGVSEITKVGWLIQPNTYSIHELVLCCISYASRFSEELVVISSFNGENTKKYFSSLISRNDFFLKNRVFSSKRGFWGIYFSSNRDFRVFRKIEFFEKSSFFEQTIFPKNRFFLEIDFFGASSFSGNQVF